jgi:hypothetical protein
MLTPVAQRAVSWSMKARARESQAAFPAPVPSGRANAPQPSGVGIPSGLEVVDTFFGAQRGSCAVIANESKLSLANGATLDSAALEVSISVEHVRLHLISQRSCSWSHFKHA